MASYVYTRIIIIRKSVYPDKWGEGSMLYFVGRHTREPVSIVFDEILYIYSMLKKTLACNTENSLRVALHGENS